MGAPARWRRVDAEHWVHVAGMVGTTLLSAWTAWVLFAGLAAGLAWAALIPGAAAALMGALTSAWRRERPWSWWAWTALAAVAFLAGLPGVTGLRPLTLAWLACTGGLLALLSHPDSRERIRRRAGRRIRSVVTCPGDTPPRAGRRSGQSSMIGGESGRSGGRT
jgi:hypothetical protein